jgi:hypothetical protein
MDWVIAIPSYRRPDILRKKTLQCLQDGGIDMARVTVFLANHEEAAAYGTLPVNTVVGVPGLAAQREYIQSHYPIGQLIVFMDDDISAIKQKHGVKMLPVTDLTKLFDGMFQLMGSANIVGVYPCANGRFMKDTVTRDCRYIIGALYGIRNTWDDCRKLQFGDNQEDKERTLRYWDADGEVVRLNYITISTAYYAKGGMESDTRKAETEHWTSVIEKRWPKYVTRVYKEKQGIWDMRFRR